MKTDLAICVPTRNHPDMCEKVVKEWIRIINNTGISLYYYDSSDGDETEKVIREVEESGSNLFYVPVNKEFSYGEKINYIFHDERLREYKYIWPIKDRAYCSEKLLHVIIKECRGEHDIIFPVDTNHPQGVYDIKSPIEFYVQQSLRATSLGSAIYRRNTLIQQTNRLNIYDYDQGIWDFWHYKCIYDGLADLKDPTVRIIDLDSIDFREKEKKVPDWEHVYFKVWKDNWICVNESLSSIYDDYRDVVIKSAVSIKQLGFDRKRLLDLYEKGVLREEVLDSVLDQWERVSDVPREVVVQIAKGEYDIFHDVTQLSLDSKAGQILGKIHNLLGQGMGVDQIPIESVEQIMMNEIFQKKNKTWSRQTLIYGSMKDICECIRNSDVNTARKYVQMLMLIIEE